MVEFLFMGSNYNCHKYEKNSGGFTLNEILVSLAIVTVLVTTAFVYLGTGRDKARDARRKSDLSQLGRFLSVSCYVPNDGAGDYDLAQIAGELAIRYPQYQNLLVNLPRDPKTGTSQQTNYRYIVSSDNRCAVYGNLEYEDEPVTLPEFTSPTPGGGQGVLQWVAGWNGTDKYFQFSS